MRALEVIQKVDDDNQTDGCSCRDAHRRQWRLAAAVWLSVLRNGDVSLDRRKHVTAEAQLAR